jgi:hypothetical protein
VAVRPESGSDNYRKRQGTGSVYEEVVPLLVCLRCLNNNTAFRLAVNVDNIGDLDDVVIKCDFIDGVSKTYFVQPKHKDSDTASFTITDFTQISGPVSLLCFFESYCLIRKFHGDNLQFCGAFENFEFILYTDARVTCGREVNFNETNRLSILSSGPGSRSYTTLSGVTAIVQYLEELELYRKIRMCTSDAIDYKTLFTSEEIRNNMENEILFKKLRNCEFSFTGDFLRQFKILQRQSPVSGVEQSIKTELQNYAPNAPWTKLQIKDDFKTWFDKTKTAEWLTESSYVWENQHQNTCHR